MSRIKVPMNLLREFLKPIMLRKLKYKVGKILSLVRKV